MEVPTKFISRVAGFRYLLLALVFMAASTLLVSCSGDGGSGGTTDKKVVLLPTTLTVESKPTAVDISSPTEITATVKDENGQLMQGIEVEFTIPDNQSDGDFAGSETAKAITNESGKASVTYTAGSTGGTSDTVKATATANSTATSTTVITVNTVPGSAPSTLSLEATFDSIPADGESKTTLKASVSLEGGGNGVGIAVDFDIIAGGGTLSTDSATTGSDGTVLVELTSEVGSPGATVRASVKSSPFINDNILIEFTLGSIEVSAAKNSLLGTGKETTIIVASIFDVDGVAMGADETINFSLDDESLGSLDPVTADTGANGKVAVEFTAGTITGTVTVTATWKSDSGDISGTTEIIIYSSPASIDIEPGSPNPTSLSIKGSGGQTTSLLSFIVRDQSGAPVVSGYRVMFQVDTGPGGGEAVIPVFDVTDDAGRVSTFLYSGSKSGPVTIRASYYSATDNTTISTITTPIVISSGPPVGQEFGISAQYLNISGLWMTGLEDEISVSAGDVYGNPVPDGNAFSFKTYNMGGLILTEDVFSVDGFATSSLFSTSTPPPMQGFTFITVETTGAISTHITSLAVTDGLSGNSIIYAGTDGGGIYKSLDSGGSWLNISRSTENARFGENIIDPYIKGHSAISIDPDDPNTVYVGTGYLGSGRIYRSVDGGANWNSNNVEEVRGMFTSPSAAVLTVLADDGSDYVWAGTEGDGVYVASDGESFAKVFSGLSKNQIVRDIVKSPKGGDGLGAVLYAATNTGVFCSVGGNNWTSENDFVGDNITSIAVYSELANDILYVGTEDAGVWAGVNTGGCTFNWFAGADDGLGSGVSATIPQPAIENTGSGKMSKVDVGVNAKSEAWTLTAIDADTFSVKGTESGTLSTNATVNSPYENSGAGIGFTIFKGSAPFETEDIFTFTTTRDPGLSVKDLLVDPNNLQVYQLTYFRGDQVEYPAGNVYSHGIDAATGLFENDTSWKFANENLPSYEDVTYLFPQFAIATDNISNPAQLFLGGSGINFYKATDANSIEAGNPAWKSSKGGLTNTIMARMPILFTDEVFKEEVWEDDFNDLVQSDFLIGADVDVYVQDYLGNPPIVDSNITVTQTYWVPTLAGCAAQTLELLNIDYGNTYTSKGTFRDPNDFSTDEPWEITINYQSELGCTIFAEDVTFTFTPTCGDTSPGCSGGTQEDTYILPIETIP